MTDSKKLFEDCALLLEGRHSSENRQRLKQATTNTGILHCVQDDDVEQTTQRRKTNNGKYVKTSNGNDVEQTTATT
jgi:hypothetical protein